MAEVLTDGLATWWTCYQFDSAVTYFGRWIDNKLEERDKQGKQKYKLSDLLKPKNLSSFDEVIVKGKGYIDVPIRLVK